MLIPQLLLPTAFTYRLGARTNDKEPYFHALTSKEKELRVLLFRSLAPRTARYAGAKLGLKQTQPPVFSTNKYVSL